MRRREFITKIGTGLLGTAAIGGLINSCSNLKKDIKKKWNFVFIVGDDIGWNQVGYQGSKFYETPNIDKIAEKGIHFTDAYAANPVCSPTRASIMTGKNPARLHITDYIPGSPYPFAKVKNPTILQDGLPMKEYTLAELFKDHGYTTGHFGKWHLNKDKNYTIGRDRDPKSQGFDDILTTVKPGYNHDLVTDAHHAEEITKRSVDFIERYGEKGKPFFCYTAHHVVHRPIMEEQKLINKYREKPNSEDPVNNPIMGAMIERMDRGVGQILNKLDELNITDKTIVIFYSDNGGFEQLQEQDPLRGGKAMVYEGGIRVPLAIKWPGVVEEGTKCSKPVISDDFFPTFASILNEQIMPKNIDGKNILPLIKQTGDIDRNTLYFHYPHYHHLGYKPGGAIREGDYKLIEWFEKSKTGEKGAYQLFNIKEDIGETNDLSDEKPELVERLKKKLHSWRKKVNAQEMTVNPNYDPEKANWRFKDRKGWYLDKDAGINGVVKTK